MQNRIRCANACIPAVLLLAACTAQQKDDPLALKIEPTQVVRHSLARAEAQYALGRYYRGQMRYGQAIEAFRAALDVNPDYAEARNALAVLLARLGQHEQAIAELERAAAAAPRAADVRNNLGYAYLLRGRTGEAVAELEKAERLDPGSARIRENLRVARQGQAKEQMTVAPVNFAAPVEKLPLPEARGDSVQPAQPVQPMQPVKLLQPVLSAQPVQPKQTALSAPPAPTSPAAEVPLPKARLEISNGNGVTGMARATARQFEAEGYPRSRLTNQPTFRMPATTIEYRQGYELQARKLQAMLGQAVPLSESQGLRADVQVRLILGRDLPSMQRLFAARGVPSGSGGETQILTVHYSAAPGLPLQ